MNIIDRYFYFSVLPTDAKSFATGTGISLGIY